VIGAYGGKVNQIFSIGGDQDLGGGKAKKSQSFQTSCNLYGPFKLEKDKRKPIKEITEVHWFCKTMIVAGDATTSAYGSVEKQPGSQSVNGFCC
jgi:hypothetical protein